MKKIIDKIYLQNFKSETFEELLFSDLKLRKFHETFS